MIQTIKQNKKAVLAFLLALVMLIGLIPFTATEVQAVTIPVGDITTNDSFGNGDAWVDGDELYFCRVSKDNQWAEYTLTANVEDEVTTWTPSEKLYWDDKGEHKLVVNYPADTGWVWDTWYILEDQSTLEKLKRADHMNAMWKGNPTTDPINLNLKHRLSMVTVTYTFASEFANEPDIAPEVYSNTQYMLFDINTLERRNVEWQEDHAIWVKPYQHKGENDEKQFTAMPVIDGTLGGKTTATEDDINALVEQLKAYVDNGITTIIVPGSNPAMIDVGLWINTAIGEAIYRLSKEDSYNGKIDLILPDVTEIVDQEFDGAHALNSINLPKVTTVGDGAFYDCQYLEELTFGSVVTAINHNTRAEFHRVGEKVEGCNLVLNSEQVNAATEYQPNVETKTWWNTEWKSITLE